MPREIFLVFTEGIAGHERDYADWFCGTHLDDMAALDTVLSARAYTLSSLDDQPRPASLCAIYETADGRKLLDEIGRTKGTDKLPVSDIQGTMSWRLFEQIAGGGPSLPDGKAVLILLYAADASIEPDSLADMHMARLSPAQSSRGQDFGHALFLPLEPDADVHSVMALAQARTGLNATRALLATPA